MVPLVLAGATLTRQGERADGLHLVLDGALTVEVDGREIAQIGPGAMVGERAILEGGTRTATLRAATRVKVATADGAQWTEPCWSTWPGSTAERTDDVEMSVRMTAGPWPGRGRSNGYR